MLHQARAMETLHDFRRALKCLQCFLDKPLPLRARQILTDRNPAAPPAKRREAADLEQQLAILLAQLSGFTPLVNFEPRNDCMLRQRGWIEQPCVWNYFLQAAEIFVA